jgi:hypothetical protein
VLLAMVPLVGWLVPIVAVCAGLGALTLQAVRRYSMGAGVGT